MCAIYTSQKLTLETEEVIFLTHTWQIAAYVLHPTRSLIKFIFG